MKRLILYSILCFIPSLSFSQDETMLIHFKPDAERANVIQYHISNIDSITFAPKYSRISDSKADGVIRELWIPELQERYGSGCYISSLTVSQSSYRLFISNEEGNIVAIMKEHEPTFTPDYYAFNSITPIIDYKTAQIVGYGILNGGGNYANSGMKFKIDYDVVQSIERNTIIQSIVEGDEQIVLLGDSKYGYYWSNCLPDMLTGLTQTNVLNCGFGGCRMSWRQMNGADSYDKFSFPDLCDAIINEDYSTQIANNPLDSYRFQIDNLKLIDLNKKVTILVNFVTNDITGNTPLGEYYNPEDITTLDRSTFLGAMSYGVTRLKERYPNVNIIFLSPDFRLVDEKGIETYKNAIGLDVHDYFKAEQNNAQLLGCKFLDSYHLDFRTLETISDYTVDGTHFNGAGFSKYAQFLYYVWRFASY